MNAKRPAKPLGRLWFRSVAKDVRRDLKAAKGLRLPRWSKVCIFAGAFLTAWLFDHFGSLNMALPSMSAVVVLVFVLVLKWKLRRHAWFWITMMVIVALHVPLILFVPWTTKWVPAVVTIGFVTVDIYMMIWILAAAQRFVEGVQTAGT